MKIALVVAVAQNNVIGADGDLAWRISDDLKWFKKVTMGKPIIMGRKTFASIGKPLPRRDNIVITRSEDFAADGVFIAHDIDAALAFARQCASERRRKKSASSAAVKSTRNSCPGRIGSI